MNTRPETSTDLEADAGHGSRPAADVTVHSQPVGWRRYVNQVLGAEISRLARYYDRTVQWRPRSEDARLLLDAIDAPEKGVASSLDELAAAAGRARERALVLLNGNANHDHDIEGSLTELAGVIGRGDRLVLVLYNPYLAFLYRWANRLGFRRGEQPSTFITHVDLANLAKLGGFEVVRVRPAVYSPWRLLGLGWAANKLLIGLPLLRWTALTAVVVLRPIRPAERPPSLTVVVPARNERGNIRGALERMPAFAGTDLEIVFVEGHSTDGTWEEIEKVVSEYSGPWKLKCARQPGKGKADAVRLGFSMAEHELLTILDADLTMPPELLERFYAAYNAGLADFVNGSRLVYPMESEAMRFLNLLGNVFFSKALSFVLDARLGDTLCGTKLVSRDDYERFVRWRRDFGDFDPFGDYELLFPACSLGLGIVDVPVRYRQREYGSTNIRRFWHGAQLLRMTWIGFGRMKLGAS